MQLANTKMKVCIIRSPGLKCMLLIQRFLVQLDEHVSNIEVEVADVKQLAGAPGRPTAPEEGEEGAIEKKVKGSLLSTLRQRFEGEANQTGTASQSGVVHSPYFGAPEKSNT
jgi:hypothetical protein